MKKSTDGNHDFIEQSNARIEKLEKAVDWSPLKFNNKLLDYKDDDRDKLWEVYAEEMRSMIAQGNEDLNLQLGSHLYPIWWNDKDFGEYYFHVHAADLVPVPGPTYVKSSTSFSQLYEQFLESLDLQPINAAALDKANAILDDVAVKRINLDSIYDQYSEAWAIVDERQQNRVPQLRKTFEEWWEEVEGEDRIQKAGALIDALEKQYFYWLQEALSPDEPALEAIRKLRRYKDLTNQNLMRRVRVPRSTESINSGIKETRMVLPYTLGPDYPNWLSMAQSGQLGENFKISFRQSTRRYNYSKSSICGGALIGFGFFGAIAYGSRTTVSINNKTRDFAFEMKGVATAFDILPDSWYTSTIFDLYKNGPFKVGSPFERLRRAGTLFGRNGLINYRPSRVIACYKPKMKVQLSKSDYSYYKRETRGWAAFGIGPFVVGGGRYHDVKINVSSNDSNRTIELFADDPNPYIIGFEYEDIAP